MGLYCWFLCLNKRLKSFKNDLSSFVIQDNHLLSLHKISPLVCWNVFIYVEGKTVSCRNMPIFLVFHRMLSKSQLLYYRNVAYQDRRKGTTKTLLLKTFNLKVIVFLFLLFMGLNPSY